MQNNKIMGAFSLDIVKENLLEWLSSWKYDLL